MAVRYGAERRACRLLAAVLLTFTSHASTVHAQDLGIGGIGAAAPGEGGGAAPGENAGEPGKPAAPAPAQQAGQGTGTYSPGPGWIINVGLTVSEILTNNALTLVQGKRSPDEITQITPTLSIHGDTPRVSMDLVYSPIASIYARNTDQDSFGQNLNGRAHAMLVEDKAYVDVYAFGGMMPSLGAYGYGYGMGYGGGGTPNTNPVNARQTLSQTYSFGVTPYAIERFGGWGTGKIGISAQTTYSGASSYTNGTGGTSTQPASNTQTLQETADFTSGENLGRFQSRTVVSGQQGGGTGITQNSSDYIAQTALTYAVNRWASVFGQIGYEVISYSNATTPYKQSDPVWSVGGKFQFGADGDANISYGRRYGTDSVSFDGSYAITAKTRVTGRIWTGFGTELQLLQADLANSGIDQYGNNVNLDTGAPLFLSGGGYAGGNQNLYRSQNFSATLSSIVFNDPVSFGVQFTNQTLIATSGTAAPFPNKSVSANASWSHAFSELLMGSLYAVYGVRDVQGLGTTNQPINGKEYYLGASANLSYTFSQTLTGMASYSHYDQSSNVPNRSYSQDLVIISLSKQF